MKRIVLAGATLACLLSPAAASAATTFVVDPAAAAGCTTAGVCKTVSDANAKVADGDTVTIKDGTYAEATIAVTKKDVTFAAANPGKVYLQTSTATAGASTFTLGDGSGAGSGTVLRGLAVGVPATGGPAVLVQAVGTLLDGVSLGRVGATSDAPVYSVVDTGSGITGGTNTIKSALVAELPTLAAAGTAPAVNGGTKTSLVISDSSIASGPTSGPGVVFNANDASGTTTKTAVPNSITRGTVLAQKAAANAVEVLSGNASANPKATVLDSVVLVPGSTGAGVRAASAAAATPVQGSTAGNIAVTAHHITVAGGGRPFALEASALSAPFITGVQTAPPPVGTITLTADHAIAHGTGASTVTAAASSMTQTGSMARLAIADSDTTDAAGGTAAAGTTLSGTITKTADATLFTDPAKQNFHLKPTAPVVDKGGPQVTGESTTDFEGQPRVTGAATDLGADEYVNAAPLAALKADKTAVRIGDTVTLDATGTTDADGRVAMYAFNFGDGTPAVSGTAGTVTHQFAKAGTFTVTLGVIDDAGATGVATAAITVADGTPPAVAFTSVKAGAKLRLFSTTVKRKKLSKARTRVTTTTKLRKITLAGTATDAAGVKFLELSLRRVSLTKSTAKAGTKTKTVKSRAASATKCTFLNKKTKSFQDGACAKPLFFAVPVKDGKFSFALTKDIPYRLGAYTVSARATDQNGVVSTPVAVSFTLR